MRMVLDASALVASRRAEPGSEALDGVRGTAVITSVNGAEVVQKCLSAGVEVEGLRQELQALGLAVEPFSAADADTAALLWPQTRNLGLSLADRACLSLGLRLNLPMLTCDRLWAGLTLPPRIELLREHPREQHRPLANGGEASGIRLSQRSGIDRCMAGNRKDAMPSSYVIGEHFEQFIKDQLQQGRYASASEVIRNGLRALEDREKLRALKLEALRADIQQGINSGPSRPLQHVSTELQARYQNWVEQGPPADAL